MTDQLKLKMWCAAAVVNPDGTTAVTLSAASPTGIQAPENRVLNGDERPQGHFTVLIGAGMPAAEVFTPGDVFFLTIEEAPPETTPELVQTVYVPPGFEAPSPEVQAGEDRVSARPEEVSPQYEDGGGSAQGTQEPQPPGG